MSERASQNGSSCGSPSVGRLFDHLPWRTVRRHLVCFLDIPELLQLTQTCWTFFVQYNEEGIWRSRCLSPPFIDADSKRGLFTYNGSWKHTVCAFHFRAARWLSSPDGAGKEVKTFGEVNGRESARVVQGCADAAEVHMRFNVLLPRLLTCLYRDKILSRRAYEWWCRRLRHLGIRDARLLDDGTAAAHDCGRRHGCDAHLSTAPLLSDDDAASDLEREALWRWQEESTSKPHAPALAQTYLALSTGAINYFLAGGHFLKPPGYALRRGQYKACRRQTEFADHNWAGECLYDLVPLPRFCSAAQFVATMTAKTLDPAVLKGDSEHLARCSDASWPPRAVEARARLPDELRGVCGAVDRRHRPSLETFRTDYEVPNTPVVLTGCIDEWPARETWRGIGFLKRFEGELLKANGRSTDGRRFRMRAADYAAYATAANAEKPMYIFDKKVIARCSTLRDDYATPLYFQDDLFDCMGEDERPDYRWVLVGPDGSGTPFHTDPHGTSAWNAVLAGRKRVTFYPPHLVPPGVEEKWIHSDYYASEPYMRWYRERGGDLPDGKRVCGTASTQHHGAAAHPSPQQEVPNAAPATAVDRAGAHSLDRRSALAPLEALVFPGDVVFIPSGWWHQVLNLGFTTAVTQNFCSETTFPRVAADMNAYADRQVRKDFQLALRRAGRDELAVQLRLSSSQ